MVSADIETIVVASDLDQLAVVEECGVVTTPVDDVPVLASATKTLLADGWSRSATARTKPSDR